MKHTLHSQLPRTARAAIFALGLALIVAAPAAAARPTRSVFESKDVVGHYAPGNGCEFAVTTHTAESRYTVMDFSSGKEVSFGHYFTRTITNDATGQSVDVHVEAHEVDWFGPEVIHGSVTGQSIFTFAVGDAAPDGSTVDHVYSIFILGKVSYVIDANTFATLAISIQGSYWDICAAIS